jgi:capsular polysaccharide transport system ATP-binding protein
MAFCSMITLRSISKAYGHASSRSNVLDGVDAEFERGRHYVILGQRGAGKSTLLRIMSGLQSPNRGSVRRDGSVSMPLGTASILSPLKTGRQLATLLANLYCADAAEVVDYTLAFSEVGDAFDYPVSALPPRLRARLNYALGYAIPSDTYLFDELIGYGDSEFNRRCVAAFESRRRSAGTIVATRNVHTARLRGDRACLLHAGKLYFFHDLAEAIEVFKELELQAASGGVDLAEALIKAGERTRAREHLREHLSERQGTLRAYELLATLSLEQGFTEDAKEASYAVLDRSPRSAAAHFVLAMAAERGGRIDEGIEQLEKAVALEPGNRQRAAALAKMLEKAGKHREAATAWLRLAPQGEDSQTLRLVIRNDMAAGNWQGVLAAVEIALSQQPNEVALLSLKVRALLELEQWDDAKQALTLLAARSVEKAIEVVYRLTKTANWHMIPDLLHCLPMADLHEQRSSQAMRYLLVFLKRKAASARKAGDTAVSDELSRAMRSLGSAEN